MRDPDDFDSMFEDRISGDEWSEIVDDYYEDDYYDNRYDNDDYVSYDDLMDGDHESALVSIGWGTDEDYNHWNQDDRYDDY